MKVTPVLVAVLVGVTVQAALARYTVGDRWAFDLVLVAVVYASLQAGAVAGILAGTVGGLLQDLLAGGIVGVGGLSKTVVGFLSGTVGSQFVLAKPGVRTVLLVGATVMHRLMVLGIVAIISQRWPTVSWMAFGSEILINAAVGFAAFSLTDATPGLLERGRMSRRSALSRRRWQ